MKSLLVAATLVALGASGTLEVAPEIRERFAVFKRKYNKDYPSLAAEETAFAAYAQNVAGGAKVPTTPNGLRLGETEFSDQSPEHFSATHLMPQSFKQELLKRKATLPNTKRPISAEAMNVTAFDWRTHGAVTKIKNQNQCGACWAFSAAANMEGQWYLYNGTSVSLSPQELVSCDQGLINKGCGGGAPEPGDSWFTLEAKGYWATDSSYPYTSGESGSNGKCRHDLVGTKSVAGARIGGWEMVHLLDEKLMAAWMVDHGPIGVCLDANHHWQNYQGGVLSDCTSGLFHMDHCVLLVGFNNTEAKPYWIVKNSWGTDWGLDGYMYLEKGKNMCNVAEAPYSGTAKKFD